MEIAWASKSSKGWRNMEKKHNLTIKFHNCMFCKNFKLYTVLSAFEGLNED